MQHTAGGSLSVCVAPVDEPVPVTGGGHAGAGDVGAPPRGVDRSAAGALRHGGPGGSDSAGGRERGLGGRRAPPPPLGPAAQEPQAGPGPQDRPRGEPASAEIRYPMPISQKTIFEVVARYRNPDVTLLTSYECSLQAL